MSALQVDALLPDHQEAQLVLCLKTIGCAFAATDFRDLIRENKFSPYSVASWVKKKNLTWETACSSLSTCLITKDWAINKRQVSLEADVLFL